LVVFLKIFAIKELIKKLDLFFNFQGLKRHIADILYLVMTLFMVIHILAVFWHGIGLMEIKGYLGKSN
jgi:hypothetical protein